MKLLFAAILSLGQATLIGVSALAFVLAFAPNAETFTVGPDNDSSLTVVAAHSTPAALQPAVDAAVLQPSVGGVR